MVFLMHMFVLWRFLCFSFTWGSIMSLIPRKDWLCSDTRVLIFFRVNNFLFNSLSESRSISIITCFHISDFIDANGFSIFLCSFSIISLSRKYWLDCSIENTQTDYIYTFYYQNVTSFSSNNFLSTPLR